MAGNRVQYIIDLVVQDKQLRQQMAKIDWEKIIGDKGKGMSGVFSDGIIDELNKLKDTFYGLNIDWKSILGEKDLGRLETQLAKIISQKSVDITKWLDTGDTSKFETTIEYISSLGEQVSELGSKFKSNELAQSMGAFLKVIAPFANETQKIETVFNGLLNTTSKSSEKITQIMAKIETATKKTGGSQATLDGLIKKFNELGNIKLPDLSSLSLDQLEEKMDELDIKWEQLEERFKGKKNSNEFKFERGKILQEMLHIDSAITKKGGLPFYDNDTVKDMKSDLQQIINEFKTEIEKLKDQLKGETFAESIAKNESEKKYNEERLNILVGKILSFGNKVEVIEPATLKKAIKQAAKAVIDLYK